MTAVVYSIYDNSTGGLLYIGSTGRPDRRIREHRRRDWWPEHPRIEIEEHPDRAAAYEAEAALIYALDPPHNLAGVPTASRLADHIRKVVDQAPPLTTEQRDRLAALLRGGGRVA